MNEYLFTDILSALDRYVSGYTNIPSLDDVLTPGQTPPYFPEQKKKKTETTTTETPIPTFEEYHGRPAKDFREVAEFEKGIELEIVKLKTQIKEGAALIGRPPLPF